MTGLCSHAPNNNFCDDGFACNGVEYYRQRASAGLIVSDRVAGGATPVTRPPVPTLQLAEVMARVEHRYYDAGHMMYTRQADLEKLHADLSAWLATGRAARPRVLCARLDRLGGGRVRRFVAQLSQQLLG